MTAVYYSYYYYTYMTCASNYLMSHMTCQHILQIIDRSLTLCFYLLGGKSNHSRAADTTTHLMRPTHWLAWHTRNDGTDAFLICNTQLPHPGTYYLAPTCMKNWRKKSKRVGEPPFSPSLHLASHPARLAFHMDPRTVNIINLSPSYVLPSGTASPSPPQRVHPHLEPMAR